MKLIEGEIKKLENSTNNMMMYVSCNEHDAAWMMGKLFFY